MIILFVPKFAWTSTVNMDLVSQLGSFPLPGGLTGQILLPQSRHPAPHPYAITLPPPP